MFTLSDYNYDLPKELIAQTVKNPPESCKFLVYNKKNQSIQDYIFSDITKLIDPDTLIIFNNTKVLKARLVFIPAKITTKNTIVNKKQIDASEKISLEIFYLNTIQNSSYTFNALIRPGKKFKVGNTIHFKDDISFHVDAITEEGRQLTCSHPISKVLSKYGQMPLPPYISYDKSKESDYQPVFAEKQGSVAAPTASLHFTSNLISKLQSQNIKIAYTTLHVGLGTFKQVDTEDIKNYNIHSEQIEINSSIFDRIANHQSAGKTILAVGTTVTRTLESLPYVWKLKYSHSRSFSIYHDTNSFRNKLTSDITLEQAEKVIGNLKHKEGNPQISFSSTLFIYPGFKYRIIDELITNFHLPKSSLLMLVAGYMGYKQMKQLYAHAISEKYRFYSFGDAMWLRKK